MKRLILLLSTIIFVNYIYAQYDDDLESMDDVNRRINNYLENEQRELNERLGRLHDWVATIGQSGQTPSGTSGGIRFDYESSSRSSSSSNYYEQQRQRKAQRDAEHQEWLKRKNEAARLAAERERQRRIEEERERQRKYDKTYTEYMITTERHAAAFHDNLEYKATTGKDFMYNYQPKGTEKLQHRYVPSSGNVSTSDIVDEQRKLYNNQNIIKPFEGKYYAGGTSNWDKNLEKFLVENKIDNLPDAKHLSEEIAANDYGESEIIDYKIELIANGCGTGNLNDINISRVAAYNASKIDIRIYMQFHKPMTEKDAMQIQTEACNQHDLDYFYGVNKKDADFKLAQTGPIKGFSLSENILNIPQKAYNDAQKERAMSEYIERKFNYTPDYYHKLVPIRKSDKMGGIHNK